MFAKDVYVKRRLRLTLNFDKGIILFLGNRELPYTSVSNTYKFRQESTFLYYTGINLPSLALLIDIEKESILLFGDNQDADQIIWSGKQEILELTAEKAGINNVQPFSQLKNVLDKNKGREIYYFIPDQVELQILLSSLLNKSVDELKMNVSVKLIKSIVGQRLVKEKIEINEIEDTLKNITGPMFELALRSVREGISEMEIMGMMQGFALQMGAGMAFQPIVSVHGEILHNPYYTNKLKNGDLLLIDAGVESEDFYATDITRTFPVGKMTEKQRDIYSIVLEAQLRSIEIMKAGENFKDVHLTACRIIADGLKETGLLMGNTDDIVTEGAHALFFPHGLGHLLGLDTHDMENLGEDYVGYDSDNKRETKFGISYLRYARELKENCIITVEPGIYFIPELIAIWKKEKKYRTFINYDLIESYLNFGGIRIEDNVLVEKDGARILGNNIPKFLNDIETG